MIRSIKGICILGSTGSIGKSTLDVIALHPERYQVIALSACQSIDKLLSQCEKFNPRYAVMEDPQSAEQLEKRLKQKGSATIVYSGQQGLAKIAALKEVDYVMAAIVGAAGLPSTYHAVQAGKRVLLANKEALVISGQLFMDEVKRSGAELLPIDSEHNAIFQCMPDDRKHVNEEIRQILLTASGGPFRQMSHNDLKNVTPEQACNHPNWSMGRKISVDSATMMNKGLELIEACWLFDMMPERVQVVVHPQSIIHSMVEYIDGSVLAQLGSPDMKTPIANALGWPERIRSGSAFLDLFSIARLDFEKPDEECFPCLRLAKEAVSAGGSHTITLNAANEIAVDLFLNGRCQFLDIPLIIEKTLESSSTQVVKSLDQVIEIDRLARQQSMDVVKSLAIA